MTATERETQPESGRDPRVDPRPGDVLKAKYESGYLCRRTVTGTTPLGNIFYRERGFGSRDQIIGPKEWRRWAAGATVVRVSGEEK